jgi:hypothetical protein
LLCRSFFSDQALLPYIQFSTVIEGRCQDWGGKCTIDAKKQGRVLYITNYEATKSKVSALGGKERGG